MSVELSESVINGRFSVSAKPQVSPGKCACCGSVSKPVVDFGFDVEFYGSVLMCGDCIREAYSMLTAMFPDQYTSQTQVVPLHNPHLVDARTINEYIYSSLDVVNRLRSILPVSVSDDEDAEKLLDESITDDKSVFEQSGETSNAPDEPVNVPGPYDVIRSHANIFPL